MANGRGVKILVSQNPLSSKILVNPPLSAESGPHPSGVIFLGIRGIFWILVFTKNLGDFLGLIIIGFTLIKFNKALRHIKSSTYMILSTKKIGKIFRKSPWPPELGEHM